LNAPPNEPNNPADNPIAIFLRIRASLRLNAALSPMTFGSASSSPQAIRKRATPDRNRSSALDDLNDPRRLVEDRHGAARRLVDVDARRRGLLGLIVGTRPGAPAIADHDPRRAPRVCARR